MNHAEQQPQSAPQAEMPAEHADETEFAHPLEEQYDFSNYAEERLQHAEILSSVDRRFLAEEEEKTARIEAVRQFLASEKGEPAVEPLDGPAEHEADHETDVAPEAEVSEEEAPEPEDEVGDGQPETEPDIGNVPVEQPVSEPSWFARQMRKLGESIREELRQDWQASKPGAKKASIRGAKLAALAVGFSVGGPLVALAMVGGHFAYRRRPRSPQEG